MYKRKAWEKLVEWKSSENKKALCIIGARQIGKTTLVREFARENYEVYVEINFVMDEDAKKIFAGKLDADTILTNLTARARKEMVPGETLILLDEIQECPEARTAIKFLVEDGRFDYVESGSLLGVRQKQVKSYPVGFEDIYYMYPMDFEEYLWANGVPDQTFEYLRKCFENGEAVTESVHSTMNQLFYSYIVVGGMPEVVQTYVDTHDIVKVTKLQGAILEQYRQDIVKYAENTEKVKIKNIFDAIPSQLNEKNRRFYVNTLDKNARLNRYENCFRWLADAGVALPCYNLTMPQLPLSLNEKHSLFKLFQSDVGLLCSACMDNIQFELLQGKMDINMGSILENTVAQQLKANGFGIFYYDSSKHGEVDFVIQDGMDASLIEVKAGKDFTRHKALDNLMAVKEWHYRNVYVLCKDSIASEGNIKYLPWYMVMFIKSNNHTESQLFEVDLSGLF